MHQLVLSAILGLLAAVTFAWGEETKAKSGKLDAKSLKGTYTVVKGVHEGKELPADHFKGSVVIITADKIYGSDKAKKEFFSASYTLETASTPAVIHMTSTSPKKEKADGVIESDGDTVRICYALPGGEAPKDFKAGVKQNCFELKRVKGGK